MALGAKTQQVQTVGSLKQDFVIDQALLPAAAAWRAQLNRQQVWLAASTHDGEEQIALEVHQAVLQEHPDAVLLLAPRHPRRADDVVALLDKSGLSYQRRSECETLTPGGQVYLVDTLGELMFFFACCDVAFVGGSLVPVGGHNLLEPAALQKPVLTGRHVQSCEDVAQALLKCGGLQLLNDGADLQLALLQLFAQPERCQSMGQAAGRYADSQRGALGRSLEVVSRLLVR